MKFSKRSGKSSIYQWLGISAVAILALLLLTGNAKIPNISITTPTGTGGTPGLVSVTKTMQLTVYDALAGSAINAPTVTIYQGQTQLESGAASSSGVYTTGSAYTTGTALTIKIVKTSYVTEFLPFSVPGMDPNSAISNANNVVSIYDVTLGAWTITMAATGGTTFTSGNTYALAQFSGNIVTITTTASETTANAGWKSSPDIINNINQYITFEISTTGSSLSVTGLPRSLLRGSTTYLQTVCPDGISGTGVSKGFTVQNGVQSIGTSDSICSGSLSQSTVGSVTAGGSASFTWQVAVGSLTGSTTQTLTTKMYYNYDPTYFAAQGNGGPNAVQTGAPSGSAAGTSFSLVFRP